MRMTVVPAVPVNYGPEALRAWHTAFGLKIFDHRRYPERTVSPVTAAITSSGRVRLSRKPEAPARRQGAEDAVVLLEGRQDQDPRLGARNPGHRHRAGARPCTID